ncbi:glycosyltransferase (plasmid) [Azospirillum brasilense]|uniref:Glycosyltransferase n=2 Tax=Azospirillum brasilense TaxID=192 RepID=A0A4D8RHB9_AZOBR|nr:glycosyltransferase [Azospirillum brasilense]QCO19936.1 glycosyltransferase [Azospirillum brasilense]
MGEVERRTTRILVDLQACQTAGSAHRGVGRYSKALFETMAELRGDRELFGCVASHHPHKMDTDAVPQSRLVQTGSLPDWMGGRDFQGGETDSLDALLHGATLNVARPDVVHVSHVFEGLGERVPLPSISARPAGQVMSATLYDLIPLRFPEHYFQNLGLERWYRNRLKWLRQADLLLAISEASRRDAIDLLGIDPSRVVSIHGGISKHFKPVADQGEARRGLRARYGINRDGFVLYTGGDDHRKNLQGAILAFANLPSEVRQTLQLAIVCSIEAKRKATLVDMARKAGLLGDDILFLGFVPEDDLVALYSTCTAFFFPSLYEGLGLPVLEAMACGAPVIGGDNSSIRELIVRQDALFDASSTTAITDSLLRVVKEPGFAEDLRKTGLARAKDYTWENTTRLALDAFDEALRRKRENGIAAAQQGWLPRRRMAMLTPLPPCRSGIADYNAYFLPYLARYFDIDLYVDGYTVTDTAINSAFRIYDARDLPANASSYDVVHYEFGNSDFHAHMLPLLERIPGVVGLHDAFLSGLMGYMEFNRQEKDRFAREMLYSHAGQARHYLAPVQARTNAIEAAMIGLPGSKRVLDHAIGVIAHSPFSLSTVRRFHPEGWRAPYRISPQMVALPRSGTAVDRQKARADLGFGPDDVIIATFGHVAWTKCGDRLLEAFLSPSLRDDARCHLVFVGELSRDDFGVALRDRIAKAELGRRVQVTGFLSDADYERYLWATDIAVQLRTNCRGSTSKGVLDGLAYGLPMVLNAESSFRDYDDDIVIKLSADPAPEEIASTLRELVQDPERRAGFARRGHEYVRAQHDPNLSAAQYAATIHEFIERDAATRSSRYVRLLAPHLAACPDQTGAAMRAAEFLDRRVMPVFTKPRVLIDISHIVKDDHGTGIPRVIRETIRATYCTERADFEAVAVERVGDQLVLAREWLARQGVLLPCEAEEGRLEPVVFRPGDQLLMLDSSWAQYEAFEPIFERARQARVPVVTAVYDLLPITLPPGNIVDGGKEWFEGWVRSAIKQSDGLVCISKAVADDLIAYMAKHGLGREGLKVGYWHLGSTFPAQADAPANSAARNGAMTPYALMVGTIEPRKSHALALDAFERLWAQGSDLSLVIAGRAGWMVDDLMSRMRRHKMLNRKLFLFEGADDTEIAHLYRNAAALLFLSKGEGFGLPLVEAAHYGTPIVCSDLPVFHEIAGDHATYVEITDPDRLAQEIAAWRDRFAAGTVPGSAGMTRLTWKESADSLIDILVKNAWYWVK